MERSLKICMVSDFFCPNTGGVETHIYYLAQCLIQRGHQVVVVTHAYGDRKGIRFLSNALKVYYLPFMVFYNGCILPTVFTALPWIRKILIRERVDVVHGHSSFSALAHEALFHAQAMDVRTVFTDHSLFGFADASSILTNKLLQFSLANIDHVVCVSHTSKENTVLRARLPPSRVSVIPNAVHCQSFRPDERQFASNPLTVVVLSRLVYRKGIDLLASLIPDICSVHPSVRFLIGGDGPKRVLLEEMRERHGLQERVSLLGTVPHSQVREILVQGQIFVNTSLTEAFCMAIVEAASCGLHVVSTRVGGIPEVLPPDLVTLVEPAAQDLFDGLNEAILSFQKRKAGGCLSEVWGIHDRVRAMYFWPDVARRVDRVYQSALRLPSVPVSLRLSRYFRCGRGFGLFFIFLTVINLFLLRCLEILRPTEKLRVPPGYDSSFLNKKQH